MSLDHAIELLARAEASGDARYADQVISLLEDGRAAHLHPHDGAAYWSVLAMARHIRFEALGDLSALHAAVDAFRTVLDGVEQTDERWPACASNLANALIDQFDATGSRPELVEAITLLRTARRVTPEDRPQRAAVLTNLGKALNVLSRIGDDPVVLEEQISVLREGLALPGAANDPLLLSNLGIALTTFAKRTGREPVFAEAVAAYRTSIDGFPPGHPDRGLVLSNLGNALGDWCEVTGDIDTLDEAITAHRSALSTGDTPDTARRMGNLATALVRRHELVRDPTALSEAVQVLRVALACTAPESLGYRVVLTNLGTALSTRFTSAGNQEDLTEAIAALRTALANVEYDNTNGIAAASALGEALTRSFELTGDADELDEAVELLRSSVAKTRDEDSALPTRLGNLAGALMRRFERVRHLTSLDEAIDTARRAVRLTRTGHPALALRSANLGTALTMRYIHIGRMDDLDEAVAALRSAAAQASTARGGAASRLAALGNALLRAHHATGSRELLTEAKSVLRTAVAEAGDADPNHAAYRSSLANSLRRTYELDGGEDDATEAVELYRAAVDAVGAALPDHAAHQFNIGSAHRARFRRTGDREAARDAGAAFLAAARVGSASTFIRATAALNAGRIAAEAAFTSLAAECLAEAIALLDRLAWVGLPRSDQEELLTRFSQLATDAAAMALECGNPEQAVELAERGRGVLLAQAIDARSPYGLLHEAAPDLASRLAQVRAELDRFDIPFIDTGNVPVSNSAPGSAAERRMALAAEHDRVIAEIGGRGLSGLLNPPGFETLRHAASDGPVILINISRYRCDALIITPSGVVTVPLEVTADEVTQRTIAFVDAVDSGGIDAELPEAAPRTWWCPTGVLAFLPLHAAAPRPRRGRTARPAVLDRVVSSYVPTLRALLHARERRTTDRGTPKTLVVSIADAPDHLPLPAAAREAETVRRRVPGATLLTGLAATADAVFDAIPTLDWLHLACHGRQDPTAPSGGYLSLYDTRLTVRRLAKGQGTGGQLAVLSACETIRGGTALADEVITVAAAVQLAGFRHVIGTLWAGRDSIAARFVNALYGDLVPQGLQADDAARSVHRALFALRERYRVPAAWAPFAHLGP